MGDENKDAAFVLSILSKVRSGLAVNAGVLSEK